MSDPKIFNSSVITIGGLSDDMFSADGRSITDPKKLINQLGLNVTLDQLLSLLPPVINSGNQSAATGIIQDPAGSAIGSGTFPAGGGGSGAIYAKYPDLKPIPAMSYTEAVFNSTTGPGHKVLHSYSPDLNDFKLQLQPSKLTDREKAIELIARTYSNALFAAIDAAATKGGLLENVKKINFTAISGRIYAGAFISTDIRHLHPSYHLISILIAYAEIIKNSLTPMLGEFYLFDDDVYQVAISFSKKLNLLKSA